MNYKKLKQEEKSKIILEMKQENGEHWQKFCAKCKWEHMTTLAVLETYGHPKDW